MTGLSYTRALVARGALATLAGSLNKDKDINFFYKVAGESDSIVYTIKEKEEYKKKLIRKREALAKTSLNKAKTTKSLLEALELKHSVLIDFLHSLHKAYAQVNHKVKEDSINQEKLNKDNAAIKEKQRHEELLDSKKTKGDLKTAYRRIMKQCHPDHNGNDEILKETALLAQQALLSKDYNVMMKILEAVQSYKRRSVQERRLLSLNKEIADIERNIEVMKKGTDEDFRERAFKHRGDPELLEQEFLEVVRSSIRIMGLKIKAFNQLSEFVHIPKDKEIKSLVQEIEDGDD